MSRSKRRTPILGITTARSDQPYKTAEHQRERAAVRQTLHVHADNTDLPAPVEFGDPWKSPKDGKKYHSIIDGRWLRK